MLENFNAEYVRSIMRVTDKDLKEVVDFAILKLKDDIMDRAKEGKVFLDIYKTGDYELTIDKLLKLDNYDDIIINILDKMFINKLTNMGFNIKYCHNTKTNELIYRIGWV